MKKNLLLKLFPNPINSVYLSTLMLNELVSLELASTREHPIDVHAILWNGTYVVIAEDGVEFNHDGGKNIPIYNDNEKVFKYECQKYYGRNVQILIEEYMV